MKKLGVFALIVFILTGCAQQKVQQQETGFIQKFEQEPLPGWVYQLPPNGDFVIGMASRSFYEDKMKDAAKQMAAVMHSRNKASYAISNSTSKMSEDCLQSGSAAFKLNVGSPQETKQIYKNLRLADETFFHDFYIALFTENGAELPEELREKRVEMTPSWYEKDGLIPMENGIEYHIFASSSNLIDAWCRATENARLEIAEYRQKNVLGKVVNRDENVTKDIAIESRQKITDLQISRSFITSELHDNLRSYKVYLEMSTR